MTSTPSEGKISENPKPERAAPPKAIVGVGASQISTKPAHSTPNELKAMRKPPYFRIEPEKSKRALMKHTPNALRQATALAQWRLA